MNSPTAATVPADPLAVLDQAAGAEPVEPAPSPEKLRAIEAVFSQPAENSALGLLGLWASTVLLKDLACEHFHLPDEDREEKKPRPEEQPLR